MCILFKFWLQVWHLFSIAGAFAASWLLGPLLAGKEVAVADTAAANELPAHQRRGVATRGFAGGLVLLLLASLVYPVLSVSPRQANRIDTTLGPSLDGDLWLEPGRYSFGIRDVDGNDSVIDPGQDRAIIEWLQTNVDGRPTIVEAVGGSEYQWWGADQHSCWSSHRVGVALASEPAAHIVRLRSKRPQARSSRVLYDRIAGCH